NHLALNRYYGENSLFPKSLKIEVPKQNFGAEDPVLRQRWSDIIQNANRDLLKCEAQAIERTITEAEAKCVLLREKLCTKKKEREVLDVEREESAKLKETIESSWNKVFRLEMREIIPRKMRNEEKSSDDEPSPVVQNTSMVNGSSNAEKTPHRSKPYRSKVTCFGCGKDGHVQSRCFAICSFCNGRKHSDEFCKKKTGKRSSQLPASDSSCDPMVDELKRIAYTNELPQANDHPPHTNMDPSDPSNQNSTRPTTFSQPQAPASRRFTHRHTWRNTTKYSRSDSEDNLKEKKLYTQKNHSVSFDNDATPNDSHITNN
ncbi:unnamed protein product, partial [Didymodactylos carnosus]